MAALEKGSVDITVVLGSTFMPVAKEMVVVNGNRLGVEVVELSAALARNANLTCT